MKSSYIVLGDETMCGMTVGFHCHACSSNLHVKIDYYQGYNNDDATLTAKDEGWIYRRFAPYVKIWFCSRNCAYHSPEAKYVETYWKVQKELQSKIWYRIKRFLERMFYLD